MSIVFSVVAVLELTLSSSFSRILWTLCVGDFGKRHWRPPSVSWERLIVFVFSVTAFKDMWKQRGEKEKPNLAMP